MNVVLAKQNHLMGIFGNMKNSNIKRFGEVKDLKLVDGGNGKWAVYSKSRQLTNVYF